MARNAGQLARSERVRKMNEYMGPKCRRSGPKTFAQCIGYTNASKRRQCVRGAGSTGGGCSFLRAHLVPVLLLNLRRSRTRRTPTLGLALERRPPCRARSLPRLPRLRAQVRYRHGVLGLGRLPMGVPLLGQQLVLHSSSAQTRAGIVPLGVL